MLILILPPEVRRRREAVGETESGQTVVDIKTSSGNLEESLRMICQQVHAYGDVTVGR